MSTWYFAASVLIVGLGFAVLSLVALVYRRLRLPDQQPLQGYSHLRYFRSRDDFNRIGTEILNGAVANDTVYVILRTGTFIDDFAQVIAKFRAHPNTRLVVIAADGQIFLSNCREELRSSITDLYENPECAGVRALLLEPGHTRPGEDRMRGYLFISDGHIHRDDEGFYTNTSYSARFLLGYCKCLMKSGVRIRSECS